MSSPKKYEDWRTYTFDPIKKFKDAKIMAHNIEAYYHDRGHLWVRCLVRKVRYSRIEYFVIRSNLLFDASDLSFENVA
tara:strand:+ start:133 stop:366 length:234 start_codon:yes stop_codon:yes gene_type:complete